MLKDNIFHRRGYPLGVITDGDDFERPEGSVARLVNMDYDVETGKVSSRNDIKVSDLLSGFEHPAGWEIMTGGLRVFSFNEPVDRRVVVVFLKNSSGEVRVYVNTWFNPPAANTDPAGSGNDYENHITSKATGWHDEWRELTEFETVTDFVKLNAHQFTLNASGLTYNEVDAYRGWFIWNATKWNSGTTDQIRNQSFACIESFNGVNTFTIQTRTIMSLDNAGWSNGDVCYLVRHPFIVHEGASTSFLAGAINLRLRFTPEGNKWIQKTNTSIRVLNGKDGGMWIGFVNRDTTTAPRGSTFTSINKNKWYGWWMDYSYPPVLPKRDGFSGATVFYFDSKIGLSLQTVLSVQTGSTMNMIGAAFVLDGRQKISILKAYNSTLSSADRGYLVTPSLYHQYNRRLTGLEMYALTATRSDDDPTGFLQGHSRPYVRPSIGDYNYAPIYTINLADTFVITDPTPTSQDNQSNGKTLESDTQYNPEEPAFLRSTIGVFAQGRMFLNDLENPDAIRYSLFNTEDVSPLQNKRNIDSTDKDENVGIELLGVNPVVFKNNSYHFINIEGQTEVNWRLIGSKAKVGCPYPRTIVRTPYGILFANEEGFWLISSPSEPPINLVRKRRLGEWLALANKENMYAEWHSKQSSCWLYVGDNLFWVCKLSVEERQIGWKDYLVAFTEPIDLTTGEEGQLYVVGVDYAYEFNDDRGTVMGADLGGSYPLEGIFEENWQTVGTRKVPFHHIETMVSVNSTPKAGTGANLQGVAVDIINERGDVQSKPFSWKPSEQTPRNLVIGNIRSDRQTALKVKVQFTLEFIDTLDIEEINSKFKVAPALWKTGYEQIR